MEEKQKMKRLIIIVIVVIAAAAALMTVSYIRGNDKKSEVWQEASLMEQSTGLSADEGEGDHVSNDEVLGKITGEDDDFTMVADPANFDVAVLGFDETAVELATPEYELHKQLKAWMDENEFWDMTEVVYMQKYMRDEANGITTLYFKIIRYPDSPLLATWNPNTAQYQFTIEWH